MRARASVWPCGPIPTFGLRHDGTSFLPVTFYTSSKAIHQCSLRHAGTKLLSVSVFLWMGHSLFSVIKQFVAKNLWSLPPPEIFGIFLQVFIILDLIFSLDFLFSPWARVSPGNLAGVGDPPEGWGGCWLLWIWKEDSRISVSALPLLCPVVLGKPLPSGNSIFLSSKSRITSALWNAKWSLLFIFLHIHALQNVPLQFFLQNWSPFPYPLSRGRPFCFVFANRIQWKWQWVSLELRFKEPCMLLLALLDPCFCYWRRRAHVEQRCLIPGEAILDQLAPSYSADL